METSVKATALHITRTLEYKIGMKILQYFDYTNKTGGGQTL